MSELRKANTGYPYFITLTVVGWIDVFTRNRYCDSITENILYCVENKGLEIYAFVIMPSHIHLVARSPKENLNNILRDFKSFVAKEIIGMIENEQAESRKDWMLRLLKVKKVK